MNKFTEILFHPPSRRHFNGCKVEVRGTQCRNQSSSSPPFHIVPGLSNFRDIGGWPIILSPTSSSHHIRGGVLYRGSDTNRLTVEGEQKLRDLGIRTEFDLRSKQQIDKAGGYKDIPGIERHWTPVFAEEYDTEEAAQRRYDLYASDGTEGIVTAFVEILVAGAPMFRTVLSQILAQKDEKPTGAFFMHCTTGNNRTGVFIAMLLLLLHVPREYVSREYELSDLGLVSTRHVNVERLLKKGAFAEYGFEEARRKCERMVGAREESMEALIAEVQRRWGSAEEYFLQVVGITHNEVRCLRELLTADD